MAKLEIGTSRVAWWKHFKISQNAMRFTEYPIFIAQSALIGAEQVEYLSSAGMKQNKETFGWDLMDVSCFLIKFTAVLCLTKFGICGTR